MEKIIVRDNGDKVMITVYAIAQAYRIDSLYYSIGISLKPKGRKKWKVINFWDDYTWRDLPLNDKSNYEIKEFLKYVTAEEILQAKLELWHSFKPS